MRRPDREIGQSDSDEPLQRVSLSPGEALRLARTLERIVDDLNFVKQIA